MKKILYIFRHGETDWNKEKRAQGWADIPLNAKGREQAKDLASVMAKVGLDVIYSSPLSRALETANIVAEKTKAKVIINDGLREHNIGFLSGHIVKMTENPEECCTNPKEDCFVLLAKDLQSLDWIPNGGESQKQLLNRATETLTEIVKNTNYQKIGISTHGKLARLVMQKFSQESSQCKSLPNAGYFKLVWDGKSFTVDEMTDCRRNDNLFVSQITEKSR